jgi:hypothetical protein
LPAGATFSDDVKMQMVEGMFLFAMVWSVGCTTDGPGRDKFNVFFRYECVWINYEMFLHMEDVFPPFYSPLPS